MIGILGGMGTQAGLDFCNKLAILNRGKIDQEYPLFLLYNKSNIPGRPESIGIQTANLSNKSKNRIKKIKGNLDQFFPCIELLTYCKNLILPVYPYLLKFQSYNFYFTGLLCPLIKVKIKQPFFV